MTTSEGVQLFTPEVQRDPYPTYALLRETAPVYKEPQMGSYVLTKYADVYGVLRDHGTYSSAQGISPGVGGGIPSIITSDPPVHTRLRGIVSRAFTPRMVAQIEPDMAAIVDELLAEFAGGETDIVELLTYPLPVIVIARLLGIPEADRERFKRWSDAVVGVTDGRTRDDLFPAFAEMSGYFAQVAAERRNGTMGDLISAVAQAEIDGQRLSDWEVTSFCTILLVAGNETTTNLLSNLLNVLADRPDLWEALRNDRALVDTAIEEALRYDGPVQMLWRTATRDVELRGVAIPAGSKVMATYAAANHDPEEFPDPESFRLDRELNRHLAFGHGIHFCLGAPLARAEARIAMNGLLDRFARVGRGSAPGVRTSSFLLRGFDSLPLVFGGASA